jgi:hypothetical protein
MAGHVVRRRELVMSLSSNGDGVFKTLARLRANPGSKVTFPWLSVMAPLYECYRFRKLKFTVVTRLPTTTTGDLVMSPDYDAADGEIAITEQFIFNNMGSTDSPIWEKMHTLVLSPQAMNRLYKSHVCMSDARFASTAQDFKTVDAAQIFICTDHLGSTGVIGKLLVDYEVEFFNPQAPTDPLQYGGAQLTQDSPNVVNAATLAPIAAGVAAYTTDREEIVPILKFPGTDGSATPCVAQFLRDYSGLLEVVQQGSGIGINPPNTAGGINAFLDKVTGPVSAANIVLPALAGLPSIVDGAGTKRIDNFRIANAKAGDFLKVYTATNTTLNDLKIQIAGYNAQ